MGLSGEQKHYIKKNIRQFSPGDIASHLDISEKEVLVYLKKKLRPEKYKRLIAQSEPKLQQLQEFDFKTFLAKNYLVFVLLFILIAISYANSLNNAFVSDDVGGILNNPDIGKISYIFSYFGGILQKAIHFTIYKIFGTAPVYFRLANIFFHLGSTFLVFGIFYILYNKRMAIIVASLFAVHPILVESVTWISGHPYVQNSFFFLLSFFFYLISGKRKSYYYISIFAYILSLSSSERGFVLCSVFFLYEWFFGSLRENWKKLIPFFAASFAVAAITLSKVGYRVSVLQSDFYLQPGTDSLLVKIPTSVASYFGLIFWPDKLSLYHTEMVFTPWEYRLTVLIFILYLGAIAYGYFKNKPISFWLIFFIIPLAPTLSPLRIAWAVAERYAYLSTLGILFVIAWIFYKLSERKNISLAVYMIFWLLIAGFSIRTMIRNTDWKNEEALWFATVKTSPSGPNIHNNLGAIYEGKGDNQKAIDEFQLAIAINPQYADAYHNLGNTYYQMQRMQEAADSYQKAVALNPRLWQSHQNLAAIYYNQGWYDLAQQEIKKAMEINPNDPGLNQNAQLIENSLKTVQPPALNTVPGS